MTAMRAGNEAAVRRLMGIISGREPLAAGAQVVAQDVVCHMDSFTTGGINTWAHWVEFIRSRGVERLVADVSEVETHPDGRVTARGRMRGTRGGKPVESGPGSATYRLEGGKIVEVWTTRRNYALMFGWRTRAALAWLTVLIQFSLWSRRPGRADLRAPAAAPA
ncbi:MAG: nuclear transport factor 2 family protein [Longimicrobiaceae bacterium]